MFRVLDMVFDRVIESEKDCDPLSDASSELLMVCEAEIDEVVVRDGDILDTVLDAGADSLDVLLTEREKEVDRDHDRKEIDACSLPLCVGVALDKDDV